MSTVAVLGAGGTIAPAIVRDLAESQEVQALKLLDLDGERAATVAATHGEGKAGSQQIDARDGIAPAIEDCDILVNAASYRINLEAMRSCLQAGCHYLDLGGLYWMTARQLELSDEFAAAGLLGLLGMGSAPGKTNLMAVQASRQSSVVSRQLHVCAAGRDLDPPAGFSVPYALRTLIDELTMPPVVLRDGTPVEIEPLAPGGVVDFGDPIGEQDTIYTLHSELLTFGESFGCREASFRLSLKRELLERLRDLAGAADEEIERAALEVMPPSSKTVSVHIVQAGDVMVRAVTRPHERWGIGGGVVSTAAPAAAAVRLLAQGRIEARGALPPERCIDPDDLFPELEARGCEFETREAEVAGT
jgi:lysine 6-dehydrogenase